MPLNLYLIKREDDVDHDEVRSVVVAAPTAAVARQTAKKIEEGDQTPEVWAPETASLTKIGTAAPRVRAGVVHMDIKSG
jgi:beta-lactamase class A